MATLDIFKGKDLAALQELLAQENAAQALATLPTSPIILATQCDWPEALHVLLASGLDPNATTRNGDTALHWAAFNGDYDLAEALLGAGANVNAVGDVGNTPLHVAAAAGHPKLMTILLAFGADVRAKNRYNNNPLRLCATQACRDLIMRINTNGETERKRQFDELAARVVDDRLKAKRAEEEAVAQKEVRGQRLRSARSRRDEEDAHEDWLSEQDRLRALAEAEACRRMAEERQKAEQEARQLAEAADKAAKKAAKEAAGAAKK